MMFMKSPLSFLGAASIVALAMASLTAAPSVVIDASSRADTIQSGPPTLDPYASQGIRIMNNRGGDYYPYEFHDASKKSVIKGVITRLDRSYRMENGQMVDDIVGFDLQITVKNDSNDRSFLVPAVTRYMNESRKAVYSLGQRTMVDTYVCIEFAGTRGYYDEQGVWKPADSYPSMTATDNDGFAFCHKRADGGVLGYVVPAWNLGNIPVKGAATRTVHIALRELSAWHGNAFYEWLESLHAEKDDLLSCPTSGFKIQHQFPFGMMVDKYGMNPTASVFHK
jgi:hypothetical protein